MENNENFVLPFIDPMMMTLATTIQKYFVEKILMLWD